MSFLHNWFSNLAMLNMMKEMVKEALLVVTFMYANFPCSSFMEKAEKFIQFLTCLLPLSSIRVKSLFFFVCGCGTIFLSIALIVPHTTSGIIKKN